MGCLLLVARPPEQPQETALGRQQQPREAVTTHCSDEDTESGRPSSPTSRMEVSLSAASPQPGSTRSTSSALPAQPPPCAWARGAGPALVLTPTNLWRPGDEGPAYDRREDHTAGADQPQTLG